MIVHSIPCTCTARHASRLVAIGPNVASYLLADMMHAVASKRTTNVCLMKRRMLTRRPSWLRQPEYLLYSLHTVRRSVSLSDDDSALEHLEAKVGLRGHLMAP